MKKLFLTFLMLGFSSHAFAASIGIVHKDKMISVKAIRFDICPNGKIAYSEITSAKESQNSCSAKKYVDHKQPITNFRNGDVSIVKAGNIEIKSPNEAFADVLHDRIVFLQSIQPAFEKRLIGIAIQNQEVLGSEDQSNQAKIFLFKENTLLPEERVFIE